jgi:hypothetical protein
MSHGGEREGAGRKRGVRNRITRELIRVEATGMSPLDYILAVLRGETAPPERRGGRGALRSPQAGGREDVW